MYLYYWPPKAPREYTIEAYEEAFATVGFVRCLDDSYDARVTRVALFAKGFQPTHAARQVSPYEWTSKLGQGQDISHHLTGVSGSTYGQPALFLFRKKH